jgi:hypothetical protein
VFSTARDSASITSFVSKWRPLSFFIHLGKQKIMVGGDDSHVTFSKKIPWWKGSVRRRFVVMKQPVLLSPKFGAMSSHIFTQ